MDLMKRAQYEKKLGPGGWHCQCCGPELGGKQQMRQFARKALKLQLRQEIDDALAEQEFDALEQRYLDARDEEMIESNDNMDSYSAWMLDDDPYDPDGP